MTQALDSDTSAVIVDYVKKRLSELHASEFRSIVLHPWRYVTKEPIPLPVTDLSIGIPVAVRSAEACELALAELSQFEEGIRALADAFANNALPEYNVQIARLLSMHLSTLDKLNMRGTFLTAFRAALQTALGETASFLLETALLWPAEVLGQEAAALAELVTKNAVNSDPGAAVFYCLFKRALSTATDADRIKIEDTFHTIRRQLPVGEVKRGVVLPLIGSLQGSTDIWYKYRSSLLLLARIMHEGEGARSQLCYKQVVQTGLKQQERLPAWLKITRHSVCCSRRVLPSRPCCSSINGMAVPMAEPSC